MARRWRNRVSPEQREFFPKRKPSDVHKEVAAHWLPLAREEMKKGKKRYEENFPKEVE